MSSAPTGIFHPSFNKERDQDRAIAAASAASQEGSSGVEPWSGSKSSSTYPQHRFSSKPAMARTPSYVAPTTVKLSRQLSSFASLLFESGSSLVYEVIQRGLGMKAREVTKPGDGVVIVTGSGAGLSRELALRFAALGFTVFVQSPSSAQLPAIISRWQELKLWIGAYAKDAPSTDRKAAETSSSPPEGQPADIPPSSSANAKGSSTSAAFSHTGTLIPLVFNSRDSTARNDAFRTVQAYCRENDLKLVALVNCVDASGAKSKMSSGGGGGGGGGIVSPNLSSGEESNKDPISSSSAARSSSSKSRRVSSGSAPTSYYTEIPIPLSIATEDHLYDLMFESYLGVVGLVQDFLPLLRSGRGRVVNVWSNGGAGSVGVLPTGPLAPAEAAFKAATKTLALELRPFEVSVSIVLPGATSISYSDKNGDDGGDIILPTVSVTHDVRSILTPESNPSIRNVFDKQVKLFQRAAQISSFWRVDDALVFSVVRRAVEARYPRAIYPVGLDSLAAHILDLFVPENLVTIVEEKLYDVRRKWWSR